MKKVFMFALVVTTMMSCLGMSVFALEPVLEGSERMVEACGRVSETNIGMAPFALKIYTHTNAATLKPVSVKFTVAIDSVLQSDGTYVMSNKTYETPVATNSGTSSFQVSSVSTSIQDSSRTWVITASGTHVKNGVNMGTQTVKAYFHMSKTTGAITTADSM